jgi:hypothetical protein
MLRCRRAGTTAVGPGVGGATEAKNAGKPNQQDPPPDGELSPKKVVDPTSGATKVVFTDARGRESR